jgi:hypothetical protein
MAGSVAESGLLAPNSRPRAFPDSAPAIEVLAAQSTLNGV